MPTANDINRGDLALDGLDAMPDVVALLETRRRARVADLACRRGEAGLAIAAEFLDVLVDGFDTDPDRVAEAELRAVEAGLEARARFRVGDAALLGPAHYELILVLDPGPPAALAPVRAALAEAGAALVARPRAEQPERLLEGATAAGFAEVQELPLEGEAVRLFALRTS